MLPIHPSLVIIVLLASLSQTRFTLVTDASQETDAAALSAEVTALSGKPLDEIAIQRLITIDQHLAKSPVVDVTLDQARVLMALAKSQDAIALEHVRSVFENAPERRGSAARAAGSSHDAPAYRSTGLAVHGAAHFLSCGATMPSMFCMPCSDFAHVRIKDSGCGKLC